MKELIYEMLGWVMAVGILLWLGAAPVMAIRSICLQKKKVVKAAKPKKVRQAKPAKTSNVIDDYSPEFEVADNFSWSK